MNKIYLEISKLRDKFKTMCYGLTKDEVQIDDAVQELYLYFLQMNPETLKNIYEKDGLEGITRYGAVVLRRSLTSVRSPFYYQYKKYYTHIDSFTSSVTYDVIESGEVSPKKHLYNIAEPSRCIILQRTKSRMWFRECNLCLRGTQSTDSPMWPAL